MIPVQEKPAPKDFDQKVRTPALQWLKNHDFPLSGRIPKDAKGKTRELEPFWRECLDDLYSIYDGICAYSSIVIPRGTGARTVDHFVAKSSALEHAYCWSNYRLACSIMNGRKGTFDDLLDPFMIKENPFVLDLANGSIAPNRSLPKSLQDQAQLTIERLGLDDEEPWRIARCEYISECRSGHISPDYLRRKCPFVWHEMRRQNALPSEPSASESA